MAKSFVSDLSTTSASNTDIAGEGIAGSNNVSRGDDVIRNLAAMLAKLYDDLGGVVTVGGTANAITVSAAEGWTAYGTGDNEITTGAILTFKAGAANTGATTIAVNSLTAKAIRRQGDAALQAGDIVADGRYILIYDADYNSSGAWVLINPTVATAIADGSITGAKLADGAVTNAKLADMAQATIKGRKAGAGTGAPVDLTATEATAILGAMVGDSGSGGTKGLVPAPASGDAAAGKYLKADGTWTTVSAGQPIPSSSSFAVGTLLMVVKTDLGSITNGSTASGSSLNPASGASANGFALSGTWKNVSGATINQNSGVGYCVRTA